MKNRNKSGQFIKGHKVNLGRTFPKERNKKISEYMKKNPPGTKYWLGKHRDEKTRKKISEAGKRFYLNGGTKPRGMLGKKHTIEYRKKMSEKFKGENGPNWQGGITAENARIRRGIELTLWREAIFARDNWTCQKCQDKGVYLVAHHIQNFAQVIELRTSIENGITFCKICHILFHKEYGKRNNTNEQLEEFLTTNGKQN